MGITNPTYNSTKPEYSVWAVMKQRCLNQKCKAYPAYGGRGITVCDEWLIFDNFIKDMGDRPSKNHQIDRVDNNKGYCKENCRWVSGGINIANTRARDRVLPRGVERINKTGNYRARINVEGIRYEVGIFKTEEEAYEAYRVIHLEWYGFNPYPKKEK